MRKTFSLKHMVLEVWLLETLMHAPQEGYTLEDLQALWKKQRPKQGVLARTTLFRHRQYIQDIFGVNIDAPDKKHYCITNPEELKLDSLANDLLASLQEYLFLDQYRSLGSRIQPQQIWEGMEHLHTIGDALRGHRKLKVRYQKFTDSEPYDAILHPYCLKASLGRWYLLAHKEGESADHDELCVQCFALDRTLSMRIMKETFKVDRRVKVETYFNNAFGVWVDYETYPVQDFFIQVTESVAHYLRTLPLHTSQREWKDKRCRPGWVAFRYHISPSPDFIGELRRWGDELEIMDYSAPNQNVASAKPKKVAEDTAAGQGDEAAATDCNNN